MSVHNSHPLAHAFFSLYNARDRQPKSRFLPIFFDDSLGNFGPWLEFLIHHHNQWNCQPSLINLDCVFQENGFFLFDTHMQATTKKCAESEQQQTFFQIFLLTTGHPKIHKPQYLRSYPKKFLCSKCNMLSFSMTQSHLTKIPNGKDQLWEEDALP